MKFMKILKKAGGILLVIIGIFFFVSALKMIFVDNPKTKAALKDAVYVDAAYPEVTRIIKQQQAAGALIMDYAGHGDPTQMSHESVQIGRAHV